MKNMDNIILTGILQTFDKPDMNGRIYKKEVWDKALRDFLIKNKNQIRKEKLEKINGNTNY